MKHAGSIDDKMNEIKCLLTSNKFLVTLFLLYVLAYILLYRIITDIIAYSILYKENISHFMGLKSEINYPRQRWVHDLFILNRYLCVSYYML